MQMQYASIESRVSDIVGRDDAYLKTIELHELYIEINTSVAVYMMEQIRGNAKAPDQNLVDLFAKTQIALAQLHKFFELENEVNPRINQMLHN